MAEEIDRARRYSTGMAVIMVDIDQFKHLNDEFGHMLGDEVLRQVSSIFHQQLRKIDVVCRYGGEEFAILLSQTNPVHALGVAEKLRKTVEAWQFPGVPRPVTISAGTANFPSTAARAMNCSRPPMLDSMPQNKPGGIEFAWLRPPKRGLAQGTGK